MQLNKITIAKFISFTVLTFLLSACQLSGVNQVVRDLPSPDGKYHAEVVQCREPDVMFGHATQVQISVLDKDKNAECSSAIDVHHQLTVRSIDFSDQDKALELEWLSNHDLRIWHHSFAPYPRKDYLGPYSRYYKSSTPIRIIFSPEPVELMSLPESK